jgi:hypothetical protein
MRLVNEVEELNLSRNKLFMMPMRCMAPFVKLVELNLSHNFIVGLEFLEPLVNLQVLDISHNDVKQWPKDNLNLNELVKLDLSSNKITDITGISRAFPKLIVLDLSNNEIPGIVQLDGLRDLPLLNELCLKGNPCFSEQLCDHLLDAFPGLDVVDDEERLVIPSRDRPRRDSETSIIFDADPIIKQRLDYSLSLVDKEFDENFFDTKVKENQAICQKSLANISETLSLMNEKIMLKRLEIYEESKGIKQLAEKLYHVNISDPKELEFPKLTDPQKPTEVREADPPSLDRSVTSLHGHLNFSKKKLTPLENSVLRTKGSLSRVESKTSNPFRIKTLKGFVKFGDKVQPLLLQQQNERLREFLRNGN